MGSTKPDREGYLCTGKSHSAFFQDILVKIVKNKGDWNLFINQDLRIMIDIIVSIYKDYKSAVDTQIESINLLAQEVAVMGAPYREVNSTVGTAPNTQSGR